MPAAVEDHAAAARNRPPRPERRDRRHPRPLADARNDDAPLARGLRRARSSAVSRLQRLGDARSRATPQCALGRRLRPRAALALPDPTRPLGAVVVYGPTGAGRADARAREATRAAPAR